MPIHRLKFPLLAGLVLLSAAPARAADYAPPMPPPQPIIVPQPVEEFAEGWYLRGDIGMSTQSVRSLSNPNYANFDSVTNVNKGFDSAPFFGAGIGALAALTIGFLCKQPTVEQMEAAVRGAAESEGKKAKPAVA